MTIYEVDSIERMRERENRWGFLQWIIKHAFPHDEYSKYFEHNVIFNTILDAIDRSFEFEIVNQLRPQTI